MFPHPARERHSFAAVLFSFLRQSKFLKSPFCHMIRQDMQIMKDRDLLDF